MYEYVTYPVSHGRLHRYTPIALTIYIAYYALADRL